MTPASNSIKVETDGADGQQVLLREERGGTYEVGLEESGITRLVGSINHARFRYIDCHDHQDD
jgi:hypothetical protein